MLEEPTEGDEAFENWFGILLILVSGAFMLLWLPWLLSQKFGIQGLVIYFAVIAIIVLPPILLRKRLARLDEREPEDGSK
jgi:hypothetical protein